MEYDDLVKKAKKTEKTQEKKTAPAKTLIQKEQSASKKYYLKVFPSKVTGDMLVKLSEDNVARAEAIMHTVYDNSDSIDKNTKNSKEAIIKLKKFLFEESFGLKKYKRIITEIVERLDSENSTHLNADGVGRKVVIKRIVKIPPEELLDFLRRPKSTQYELIHILEKKTKPKDKNHVGRTNTSFASKFCHYLCFYLFEGKRYQDNYPIYDSIVRNILPRYMKHYGIELSIVDYESYTNAIDEIIRASGVNISRNGFDHLLWIYYN